MKLALIGAGNTGLTQAIAAAGLNASARMIVEPFDNTKVWLQQPAFDAPLPAAELAQVQREVDSIVGTTRNNESIAKVVWNGDRRYWKYQYRDWDVQGNPKGELFGRPRVLYRTVFNSKGEFVRDAFPPRYLILTRLEPEQYAATWARDSKIYCPQRKTLVQLRQEAVPKEYWLWFGTIAEHNGYCCEQAAENDIDCHGQYAHPRKCLEDLRSARKRMEENGGDKNSPFDSPDRITQKLRENATNNYEEQAVKKFAAQQKIIASETPLALAPFHLVDDKSSLSRIKYSADEIAKRNIDDFERRIRIK